MKDFFKKIWEWIKTNVAKAWSWLIATLLKVPVTKLYYFIAGLVATAFLAIVLPKVAEWPIVPVAFLIFIFGFFRTFFDKKVKWWNCLAIFLGALVIQFFCWIA